MWIKFLLLNTHWFDIVGKLSGCLGNLLLLVDFPSSSEVLEEILTKNLSPVSHFKIIYSPLSHYFKTFQKQNKVPIFMCVTAPPYVPNRIKAGQQK